MSRSNAPRSGGRPFVDPGAMPPDDAFDRPVFEFDRRLRAVERAFYRHLLRVIDLDALFDLEQRLWALLQDQGQITDDQVLDLANAVIERALERVGTDPIRAMKGGVAGPDGRMIPAPKVPHVHCPFCDGEPEDGEPEDGEPDDDEGSGPSEGSAGPSESGPDESKSESDDSGPFYDNSGRGRPCDGVASSRRSHVPGGVRGGR